jgi:colicin import membrane protein
MQFRPKRQGGFLSFLVSLLLHLLVLSLVFGSAGYYYYQHENAVRKAESKKPVVHAVAVNQHQVEHEIAQIKARAKAKREAQIAWQQHLQHLANQAKQQRIAEQRQLKYLQQQQLTAEQKAKQQQAQATAQLNRLERLREQAQRQLDQLHVAATQLKQKNEKVSAQLAATKQALAKEKSAAAKQRLEARLAREKAEKQQLQRQQMTNEIAKFKTLILRDIGKNWIIPTGANKHLSCQLLITLNEAGRVENVQLLQSSGNRLLDRSAVAAVYKASPLPVPQNPILLKQFTQLKLTVRPEGLLGN